MRLDVEALAIGSPQVVDLDLIKAHCGIDGEEFDELLAVYLAAAIEWIEGETHRTVVARGHRWVLSDFPREGRQAIRLPRGKTISIESIDYDNGAAVTTLYGASAGLSPAASDYREDLLSGDGGVILPPASGWPPVDCRAVSPVAIRFVAGWQAAEIPNDIVHAILLYVSDAVDLRGAADIAPAVLVGGAHLAQREALVSGYRLSRWY